LSAFAVIFPRLRVTVGEEFIIPSLENSANRFLLRPEAIDEIFLIIFVILEIFDFGRLSNWLEGLVFGGSKSSLASLEY